MDNNKKPNEPPEAERWAKSEDLDRKIEEEEAERWVRISIVENAGLMGLPIPAAITKAIDILKQRAETPEKGKD